MGQFHPHGAICQCLEAFLVGALGRMFLQPSEKRLNLLQCAGRPLTKKYQALPASNDPALKEWAAYYYKDINENCLVLKVKKTSLTKQLHFSLSTFFSFIL